MARGTCEFRGLPESTRSSDHKKSGKSTGQNECLTPLPSPMACHNAENTTKANLATG